MTIRFACDRDIPGMIDLLQQVGEVHHRIRPDLFRAGAQKYDEAALNALLTDPNRPILAAEIEGKLVGYAFCILQVTENDPVLCDRKVLYIDDLCVEETLRGQGIAGALYERVLEYARELDCDAVTLNVWCGNENAMKFYEKCGLKPQKIGMETILC
jgi:ribosomal protein S18 acetylase RimI-like enzyme